MPCQKAGNKEAERITLQNNKNLYNENKTKIKEIYSKRVGKKLYKVFFINENSRYFLLK